MITKKLIAYMKDRAVFENVEWNLEDSWIETMFVQKGTRIFFGVILDDLGNILRDERQPLFYQGWLSRKEG